MADRYLKLAESPLPERERKILGFAEGITWADALALKLFMEALHGKPGAMKEIREAMDLGPDEGPIALDPRNVAVEVIYEPLPQRDVLKHPPISDTDLRQHQ
jgi:hypothetical protein